VRGLTTVFLVSGMGVEDQENGILVNFFVVEQQIKDTFDTAPVDFLGKMLSLCFSGCIK
jgi:hypothetical protein